MQRARRNSTAILLAIHSFLVPYVADAACNLIPVAKRAYPSTLGGVSSPITAPGPDHAVEIEVGSCETSVGFEPIAASNTVTLRFEPPGAGPDTEVAIGAGALAVRGCNLPGGRCRILALNTPDTTLAYPPNGLAGPARIIVRDHTNAVVAEIGELFLPTTGCDRQPETVFKQFTVLPAPNNFADAVANPTTPLSATVDGGGNLLIPFDYWGGGTNSVLAETPGAPVAIFLEGSADIPAMSASDPQTIQDNLAAQPSPSDFLRSFTLGGRPLPPLLRVTSTGGLYGTADATESVLRVAKNDGKGGPDIYNLSDRLTSSGTGPILIDTFSVAVEQPVPLKSLRSSAETVAYARDEARENAYLNPDADKLDLVPEVIDAATGVGTSTAKTVTEVPNGFFIAPELLTAGVLTAFLESEVGQGNSDIDADGDTAGNILRVFDSHGNDLTAAIADDVAFGPLVDRRSIAISGMKTFFRLPGAFIEAKFDGVGGVQGMHDAQGLAISPDGSNVYVASDFDNAIAVFRRNSSSGKLTFVEAKFESDPAVSGLLCAWAPTVSPDGAHVYVASECGNSVAVFTRNATTGALTFVEAKFDGVGADGLRGAQDVEVSPDGAHVYVAGTLDNALAAFARNPTTGALTFVEAKFDGAGAVNGLSGAWGIAISPDGAYVYATGVGDNAIAVFSRNPATGALTFVEAKFDEIGGVDGLWQARGVVVSSDGRHVYVTGSLDNAVAVFARHPGTGMLTFVEAEVDGVNGVDGLARPETVAVSPDGLDVYVAGNQDGVARFRRNRASGELTFVESMFDGIAGVTGVFSPWGVAVSPDSRHFYVTDNGYYGLSAFRARHVLGVFDAVSRSVLAFKPAADEVAVADERAAILRPESFEGIDLNGDNDAMIGGDLIAQLYDVSRASSDLIDFGVAASRVALSSELVAVTAREANENQSDPLGSVLNDDGDRLDDVLEVFKIGGALPLINTHVAADAIGVTGSRVVFITPEVDEGPAGISCEPANIPNGCDLNGDTDAEDRVLRIYDYETRSITEVTQAAEEFVLGGRYVAFRTSEAKQGFTDLNGDGGIVDEDRVMQVYDLETGDVMNTGFTAIPCDLPGCDPTLPYKINGDTVSFLTNEVDEGNDMGVDRNGDGDTDDIVLTVYNLKSRQAQVVATVVNSGATPVESPPMPLPTEDIGGGTVVFVTTRESDLGTDINGDGVVNDEFVVVLAGDTDEDGTFDDADSCVQAANADAVDADSDGLGDTACDPNPVACPSAPLPGCRGAESRKSSIHVKNDGNNAKDSVRWKWSKGEATTLDDIGNPVDGLAHYSLCMYDQSAAAQPRVALAVVPGRTCSGKPCWKSLGTKAVGYNDKLGGLDGVQSLKLSSGVTGKAKIGFQAKGAAVDLQNGPSTLPIVVQLVVNEHGRQDCWEATYSTATRNDGERLSAKSD